jgi:hypothetical protein
VKCCAQEAREEVGGEGGRLLCGEQEFVESSLLLVERFEDAAATLVQQHLVIALVAGDLLGERRERSPYCGGGGRRGALRHIVGASSLVHLLLFIEHVIT